MAAAHDGIEFFARLEALRARMGAPWHTSELSDGQRELIARQHGYVELDGWYIFKNGASREATRNEVALWLW